LSHAPNQVGLQGPSRRKRARTSPQRSTKDGIDDAKEQPSCTELSRRAVRRLEISVSQREEEQRQHAARDEKTKPSLGRQDEHGGKYEPE